MAERATEERLPHDAGLLRAGVLSIACAFCEKAGMTGDPAAAAASAPTPVVGPVSSCGVMDVAASCGKQGVGLLLLLLSQVRRPQRAICCNWTHIA